MRAFPFAVIAWPASIALAAEPTTWPICSFETPAEIKALLPANADVQGVSDHATDGRRAIQVVYQPAEWPQVKIRADKVWDWHEYESLLIDITNPGAAPVGFGIRADDEKSAKGQGDCRQGNGTIEPGKTATFALPLGGNPMSFGMRGLPLAPSVRVVEGDFKATLDRAHLVEFQVFMHAPKTPTTLILDNARLGPWHAPLDKIVDEYGQYAKADWPGKLKRVGEFTERRRVEEAELQARPTLPDRDQYGGWAKGPTLKATGFFRTEKIGDQWWLVTPDGQLFISLGIDVIHAGGATFITGRDAMFAWLPGKDDPLARFFGHVSGVHSGPVREGRTFDFLAANLERKFGREFLAPWLDQALRRLPSWGFNTIGNWSDRRLAEGKRVPYVATTWVGGNHKKLASGSDYWDYMHDPFDPRFAADVAEAIRSQAAKVKDDPWCLGHFVDNELSWGGYGEEQGRYGLAIGALARTSNDSPGKKAFVALLGKRYDGKIEDLNKGWGTRFTSWEELDASFKAPIPSPAGMKRDMAVFVKELARTYFAIVQGELRKGDPNHLYLGCRFAWATIDSVEAADEITDVLSFNIYEKTIDVPRWQPLRALNRPCIIGEFHSGALDRGMFHPGLVSMPDQAARAAMYQTYVRSVIDHPNFVGCHWFQYVDEPLTGRTHDGENYNIGFVTVTDTPYPEMVQAAREVHQEAYGRRFGGPR
ncbi:MAG TPA: hypothetical protein PKY77_23885 [Phycisphaerae bacterium]|nr:hypothetical protein [Phycisphaerae bacterium]HRY71358.1 hypothetical protein [Phycisphaerae bacterium]HSA30043.1 hypothetical protein [Phycisphaerae bacterium]